MVVGGKDLGEDVPFDEFVVDDQQFDHSASSPSSCAVSANTKGSHISTVMPSPGAEEMWNWLCGHCKRSRDATLARPTCSVWYRVNT
jgi:hypothetical protein